MPEVLDSARFGARTSRAGRYHELNDEPADAGHATDAGRVPVGADDADGTRSPLPVVGDGARSLDPSICPFLRRDTGDGLVAPSDEPGYDHTCTAIGAPRPQSLQQQELVCLRSAHADCPRYLRGVVPPGQASARSLPTMPRATLAALLILVLSAGISFGYVIERGGLEMPATAGATDERDAEALLTEEPAATDAPSTTPLDTPTASPDAVSPSPPLTPSPSPTPTPSPTPSPTPKPTAKPKPRPTATPRSNRYALLKPCPDRKGCWIYTVRSGDNLSSIANYFGVKLSVIYAWNPRYQAGAHLRAGDQIRMPPPTR